MIVIACRDCGVGVRVTGDTEELSSLLGEMNTDWYPNNYPCPSATCTGKAEFLEAIEPSAFRMLNIYDLTPHEAYAAFHGLGLPEERDCGPTAVEKVLLESRIAKVHKALVRGSNRTVIYSLELENGTTLYLGASAYGAVVYRIAKPESAVERVDDEG